MKYIEVKRNKLGHKIRKLYRKDKNGTLKYEKFITEDELMNIVFNEEYMMIGDDDK